MPNIYEAHQTRSFSAERQLVRMTLVYHINGTDDEVVVYNLAVTTSPLTFDGLIREGIGQAENRGGGNWLIDVNYATIDPQHAFDPETGPGGGGTKPAPSAPGDTENLGPGFSFDTTGGRAKITQGIANIHRVGLGYGVEKDPPSNSTSSGINLTVDGAVNTRVTPDGYTPHIHEIGKSIRIYGPTPAGAWTLADYKITGVTGVQWDLASSPAPVGTTGGKWYILAADLKGAVNVSGDRVEGCEIPVPQGKWTRTVFRAGISLAFYRACKNLVGKVNNAPWYGFPKGTVMYLGMQGTPGRGNTIQVTHHFHDEEDKYDVAVGNGIFVPKKGGHEFLWCRYKAGVSVEGVTFQSPFAAYVDQVVEYGAFGILEIGT